MMRLSISLLFFFAGSFLTGRLQAQTASNISTVEIQTKVYCSHCKACETCGMLFDKEIYKLKGVKTFQVNPEKNTITVTYNPKKIDLLSIKQCIAACGYDADEVKATPDGLSKLDGCCKKTD